MTQLLEAHGQWSRSQIDAAFEEAKVEGSSYSDEFYESMSEEEYHEYIRRTWERGEPGPIEYHYNFHFYLCEDWRIPMGVCRMKVEMHVCPTCGAAVTNTPDNVNRPYTNDLVHAPCHARDPTRTKGIVIRNNPMHHGYWQKEPILTYTGTDYFVAQHADCAKADDGIGAMLVHGVWIEPGGRLILGLECRECGVRNAIKPFTQKRDFRIVSETGEWRHVESPALAALAAGEGDDVEYKASFRYNYETGEADPILIDEVVKTIAAFANGQGGTLLVGVTDDGVVVGLEPDIGTYAEGDIDTLQLAFWNAAKAQLGYDIARDVSVTIETMASQEDVKQVMCVRVSPTTRPRWVKRGKKQVLYHRAGNTSQSLTGELAAQYCQDRFPEFE